MDYFTHGPTAGMVSRKIYIVLVLSIFFQDIHVIHVLKMSHNILASISNS